MGPQQHYLASIDEKMASEGRLLRQKLQGERKLAALGGSGAHRQPPGLLSALGGSSVASTARTQRLGGMLITCHRHADFLMHCC